MGFDYLVFFAVGYWTAGLVIYTDRMIRRVRIPFKRRMLRIALCDLMVALIVLIVKFGGR